MQATHVFKRIARVTAVGLALIGTSASATLIDFESFPGSFVSHTEAGVTFSAVGGGGMVAQGTPGGSSGIRGDGTPIQATRADIAGGTTSVSVELGDFNSDADLLFLRLFDSADVLLASTTLLIDASASTMFLLSASSAGTAYAIFGSESPSINGSSVLADNFSFDAAQVPEPSTLLLLAVGLIAAGRMRRRGA